jgi:hypothetical protein
VHCGWVYTNGDREFLVTQYPSNDFGPFGHRS